MALRDYPSAQGAPQNPLQSLLQPSSPIRQRLAALDAAREVRISQLHRAASLRWESRGRLARQREERDVPPVVDRAALQERAYAVAMEAVARFYDRAIVEIEQHQSAWTPATVEQIAGGNDDDAV